MNCVGKAGGEGSGAFAEVILDAFEGTLTAGADWKAGSLNSWPFRRIGTLFLGEGSNEKLLTNRDHTDLEVAKPGLRVDALGAARVDIGH